jgi:hypothetical protein
MRNGLNVANTETDSNQTVGEAVKGPPEEEEAVKSVDDTEEKPKATENPDRHWRYQKERFTHKYHQ